MLHHGNIKIVTNLALKRFAGGLLPLITATKASRSLWLPRRAFIRLERSSHHSTEVEPVKILRNPNNNESVGPEIQYLQKYSFRRQPKLVQEGILHPFWTSDGYIVLGEDEKTRHSKTSNRHLERRMKATVQILTTPTVDTPGTTVMLQCDDQRYLFGNLSEGSQRVAIENDWKLSKITNLFLSGRIEWKTVGGLLGTALTLAESLQTAEAEKLNQTKKSNDNIRYAQVAEKGEAGTTTQVLEKQRLKLYGGPNLTQMLATARKFIFRKGMPLDVNELAEIGVSSPIRPIFSDRYVQVWAMGVKPTSQKQTLSPSPTQSPRKRSFDEFRENPDFEELSGNQRTDHDRDLQICKAVVNDMFDSSWRYDTLVEVPLSQVQLYFNGPPKLFVRNPVTHHIEKLELPDQSSTSPGLSPDMMVMIRKPWPATLVSELPHTTPSATATSYFVRCQSQRGKFQIQKAKALSIPPGPLYTRLANGESIELEGGQIIHPEDVLDAEVPGNGFAVIDVPSPLYVKDLSEKAEWKNVEIMDGLKFIIWNLGPSVGEDEEFRAFLAYLKSKHAVDHLVSSPDYCTNNLGFSSVAISTNRLRRIDNVRFPHLIRSNSRHRHLDPETAKVAHRGYTWNLHPASSLNEKTAIPNIEISTLANDIPPEVTALAQSIRRECDSKEFIKEVQSQGLPSPDAEIICLGTGSAQPSKYRNVSGTLLRVPRYGSYLLDCGENTLGQLRRVYNPDELAEVLRDLKMIWISHLHADHHLGIVSVIKAWHCAVHGNIFISLDEHHANIANQPVDPLASLREAKRLFVASDIAMNQWLAEYARIEDYGYDKLITLDVKRKGIGKSRKTYLSWGDLDMSFRGRDSEIIRAIRVATGLDLLEAANVDHCHGAKAVSLTFPTGFKFSFSGDCRPSQEFIRIGKGSTVLVHEATFDDELQGDAVAKKHSTISEAIGVGMAMGAKRILLTHFSQRYQKIPTMSSVEGKAEELAKQADNELVERNDVDVVSDALDESGTGSLVGDPSGNAIGDLLPKSVIGEISSDRDDDATSDLSNLSGSDTSQHPKVAVAFDYMRVKVKDIMVLEKLMPPITALFDLFEKKKDEKKERNKAIMTGRDKQKAEKREKALEAQVLKESRRNRSREEMQHNAHGVNKDFNAVAPGSGSVEVGSEAPMPATG